VVAANPSGSYESAGVTIPNIWKVIKNVPNHQPVMILGVWVFCWGGKCWYILQIAPWSILQNIANGRLLNLAARLLLDFDASIDSR